MMIVMANRQRKTVLYMHNIMQAIYKNKIKKNQ